MTQRTGKKAADIFGGGKSKAAKAKAAAKTPATKAPANGKRRPGRPATHEESWTKVTTVLFNRQIAYLDRLGADIRVHSGAAVSRTQLIRALIDALETSGMDVKGVRSEAELRDLVTAKLK